MSYKTILVHIDPGNRCSVRVEVAIRLARQHDAHLIALHALAPFEPPGYVLAEMGPAIIEAQRHVAATEMARTEGRFTEQVLAADLRAVEWRSAIADPVDAMTLHARYADLLVIGQTDGSDGSHLAADFPERLVLAAGRPVLILPSVGSFATVGKRILVAWNRAARPRARSPMRSPVAAGRYGACHGGEPKAAEHGAVAAPISALSRAPRRARRIKTDHGAQIDVGNELLSRAADLDADLIVMGGYGHSRLKEWVLGGATRTILKSMTAPVLMSH
jgi:nucleotide-binding universal stress UspA family protein